tara:strand:- start:26291 stop:27403 length:1113 start_codon:yes stop_codon:yes gene_type:complete
MDYQNILKNKRSALSSDFSNLNFFEDLENQFLEIKELETSWVGFETPKLIPNKEKALKLHFLISLTRAIEEELDSAFRAGHIPGTAFFGRGNEGASVGSAFCLKDDEWLVPMHRNCGSHIAKGHPPESIMAHFFGRKDGPSEGRDGNFHMGYRPKNITQLISHIGTMVPIATGLAWAEKYRKTNRAVLTHIGEGGTSSGDFHEGINFASVQKLPLVIIIDNNQYAYKTLLEKQYACKSLVLKSTGYGIPGYLVDGTNILLVNYICELALKMARKGEGPILIESITMRASGHSVYDKFSDYVDIEDMNLWLEKRDPIKRYDQFLINSGIVTQKEIEDSHLKANERASLAKDIALKSPFPKAEGMENEIFAD